jgi:hypothetical protein
LLTGCPLEKKTETTSYVEHVERGVIGKKLGNQMARRPTE